jgi:hypothetical protein
MSAQEPSTCEGGSSRAWSLCRAFPRRLCSWSSTVLPPFSVCGASGLPLRVCEGGMPSSLKEA